MPTGNVVRITAPAAGISYNISMCQTNGGAAQADGIDDSQLTILDVNSAAAISLSFNDDFCPTSGANGYGPSELNFTATAAGDVFIYLTEWNVGGTTSCIADGVNSSYVMTVTKSSTAPPCDAGVLTTTGSPFTVCPVDSFTVATDGSEVTPNDFAILFTPLATGTGALNGVFTLTGVIFPYTNDAGLSGLLAAQTPPLLPMSGEWSLRTVARDGTGTACSTSLDSIIVDFVPASDPSCGPVVSCDNGNILGTLIGTIQNICPGDSTQLATDGTEVVPTGETYGWYFQSNTMPDSIYILTGPSNFFGPLGTLVPDDSYSVWGFSTDSSQTAFCGGTLTVDSFEVNILAAGDPLCSSSPSTPCTTAASTYADLNNAGGAPCNDGTSCITTSTQWDTLAAPIGVFGSEAYLLDNVQSGFDYVFDMCSGFGAGAWIPAITIVAPSGAVDTFNLGTTGTFAMNCSLAWTASESGTYTIVIHEQGVACNTETLVDNGTPTVTCGANPALCIACTAGGLTSASNMLVCNNTSDSIVLDGTESTPSSYTVGFSPNGGTGGIAAGFSIININSFPWVFDAGLNGVLAAETPPLAPLSGLWDLTVYNVDAAGNLCDSITTIIQVNFLDSTDALCNPTVQTCNTFNVASMIVGDTCGQNTGAVDITVTGGYGQNTYSWTNGAGVNEDAMGLSMGSYSVTITDSLMCDTTIAYNVMNVGSNPVITTSNMPVTNCASPDGSATVSVTSANGTNYMYSWDDPMTQTTSTASNLSAGTYTVMFTDEWGCSTSSSTSITNSSGFSATVDVFTDVTCNGLSDGVINTTVNGGSPSFSYVWSDQPSVPLSTGGRSDLSAGAYTIVVTDGNMCTYSLGPITIDEPDVLVATVTNSQDITCHGLADGLIDVNIVGGNGGNSFAWTNGGGSMQNASALSPNSYALTVTDSKGCMASTVSTTIIDPDPIVIAIDNQNDVSCNGANDGNILVTTTGGTGTLSFDWDNAPDMEDAQNISGNTYQLTVTDVNGCSSMTSMITIDEPDAIVISIDGQSDISCNGEDDGSITTSVTGGVGALNISWTNGAGTSLAPTSLAPNSYQLTVTDASNCSETSPIITLVEPQVLTATATSTDESLSGGDGTATVTATGGILSYSYVWTPSGQTNYAATGLSAGSYSCLITDNNNCTFTITVDVAKAVAIGEIALTELKIYPNPSNGTFIVQFETKETMDIEISLMSTIGKQVYVNSYKNVNGNFVEQINVQELSSGIYFLEISNKDSKSISKITISK